MSSNISAKKLRSYLNPRYLKNPVITGTFFLTTAGLISKLIGFFYRIFLSRVFNEESLGVFGLIGPVMMLVHSVCAAGIQNAITRYVAASKKDKASEAYSYLFTGIAISTFLSGAMAYVVFHYAPFIAIHIIGERRCIPLLRISALSFPLATLHSCINGFFYGLKKAAIPSWSMLLEQTCRVLTVYILSSISVEMRLNMSLSYICLGLLVGEFASAAFSCFMLAVKPNHTDFSMRNSLSWSKGMSIISLALPLSLNRICISLISTIETIQLPKMLVVSGITASEALSIYGVFSGMAIPLIMFPSAFTGSASSLLLPSVSEAQAQGNTRRIQKTIYLTIGLCFLLGVFCFMFFFTFANVLGKLLFDSDIAASQIRALSFVCPFLYMSGTLSSILHGLGKTGITFLFNLSSILMRLVFVFAAVPRIGFSGYIYGTLISQVFYDFLIILALRRYLLYDKI